MKGVVLITLALTITLILSVSAIPVSNGDPFTSASSESRDKRSDWGYYYDPPNRFSRFVPSARSLTTSVTPTTAADQIQQTYNIGRAEGGESYVWQSTPDYTYSIHQRHPLLYPNYYYPNGLPYITNAW